ncbi:serine aminopeptidase domain-containing protein [Roseateles chitinivorans]|uniref:serine aminopeptidase domain-containing protein n=1 Tax=Roseateles chitinivorans TaxID=2917965 RepID=UPI003D6783FB
MLPGMDGTGDLFEPFLSALPSTLRPVVVRYPADRWLDDDEVLAQARRALPDDEPFILLGESFSGPIALKLAAEHPLGLRGVVLAASFARYPNRALALLKPMATWVPMHLLPKGAMSVPLLGGFATATRQEALHRAVGRVAPAVMARRARQVLSFDATAEASRVAVTILCLRASRDRIVAAGAATEIAARNPRCTIVDIDAPHMLLQCAPAAAAQAIGDVFEEQEKGSPHA